MNKEKAGRIEELDILKGIAICLVVLGHNVADFSVDYNHNVLFLICYSFHMPLFIFISGYLVGRKNIIDFDWLKARFFRLMIPYLFWSVFYAILNSNTWYNKIFEYLFVNSLVWFLINLFLCDLVLYLGTRMNKKIKFIVLVYIAFFVLYLILMINGQ